MSVYIMSVYLVFICGTYDSSEIALDHYDMEFT